MKRSKMIVSILIILFAIIGLFQIIGAHSSIRVPPNPNYGMHYTYYQGGLQYLYGYVQCQASYLDTTRNARAARGRMTIIRNDVSISNFTSKATSKYDTRIHSKENVFYIDWPGYPYRFLYGFTWVPEGNAWPW